MDGAIVRKWRSDVKKRFTEAQIIGFLPEAEAGLQVKDLCRRHGFSEASYYLWRRCCFEQPPETASGGPLGGMINGAEQRAGWTY